VPESLSKEDKLIYRAKQSHRVCQKSPKIYLQSPISSTKEPYSLPKQPCGVSDQKSIYKALWFNKRALQSATKEPYSVPKEPCGVSDEAFVRGKKHGM